MAITLPVGRAGQALALGLTGLVLLVTWLGVAAPLLAWHADRAEDLAQRELLARRMARVAATLPELRKRLAGQEAASPASALIGGETDAIAAADLQQRLQEMAARVDATLSSVEALPSTQTGEYRRIALRVATNATLNVLAQLLASVATSTPRMLVDDLQIRSQRLVVLPPDAPLDASLTVLVFRAAPAVAVPK